MLGEPLGRQAFLRNADQVALDVGHEDRHPDRREALSHDLQGHRLAGPGRPGDQTVTIGQGWQKAQIGVGGAGNQ
jgi:hypothetical protein